MKYKDHEIRTEAFANASHDDYRATYWCYQNGAVINWARLAGPLKPAKTPTMMR